MKRIAFWILLLLLGASIVHAGQNLIYEKEFYRDKSKPYDQIDEFLAAGGSAKIIAINGSMEDGSADTVSSSVVKINGTVILDSSNFNQKVDQIERIVDLREGTNTITANLKGKPGGKITIKFEQETSTAGVIDWETGGEIVVEDPDSSIIGAKVEIPPGAADQDVEIVIAATELPEPLPSELFQAGANVNIISNVEGDFKAPVSLTIPYNDANNDHVLDGTTISEIRVGVKYFNGVNWEEVEVVGRDTVNNTVTVETTHFSNYVAYAQGQTPVYDVTQIVANGTIEINGVGDDWAGLVPEPVDPEDYTQGDSDWDIKHVYTAIDDHNAYLMIETYGAGPIPADATIEVYVNYKSGEEFPWLPYADMGMNHHPDFSSFWNYSDALDVQGFEVSRGNVLELKIPRSEIENATYFNVIFAKIWLEHYDDVYDEFSFGPFMDFWIHHRENFDSSSLVRLSFELYDENHNFVNEDIHPQSVTLINLDNSNEQPIDAGSEWEPWFLLFGRWIDWPNSDWYFDDFFNEGGGYYVDVDSLDAANYRLRVIDQQGNKYERDFYYNGPAIVPHVYPSINDDNLFFDSSGNLHAYWESPISGNPQPNIRFYVFEDDGQPDFTAIWAYAPVDVGHVIIPESTLQLLYAKNPPFSVGFQVRSDDRSNRWYADTVPLSAIPTVTPSKWQQPITGDWATIFYPDRWYPQIYGEGARVTVNTNSVKVEAGISGQVGQATYISKYDLEGDFDIQVDFNIDDWPADGIAGKYDTELDFQIGYGGDNPRILIGIAPSGNSVGAPRIYFSGWSEVETSDTSGKFRIERIGSTVKTYYWDNINSVWINLETHGDIGPQPIHLIVDNWGFAGNPGLPAAGTFSNFKRTK